MQHILQKQRYLRKNDATYLPRHVSTYLTSCRYVISGFPERQNRRFCSLDARANVSAESELLEKPKRTRSARLGELAYGLLVLSGLS